MGIIRVEFSSCDEFVDRVELSSYSRASRFPSLCDQRSAACNATSYLEEGYRIARGTMAAGLGLANVAALGVRRSTGSLTCKVRLLNRPPRGPWAAPRPAAQPQVAYQTVNTLQCVSVPVTQYQTQYRTEYRTENVPVTRMVPETVNETRTITRFIPQQETINKQVITHYVCEQVTEIKKCYRPVPVTSRTSKRRSIRLIARPKSLPRKLPGSFPNVSPRTYP